MPDQPLTVAELAELRQLYDEEVHPGIPRWGKWGREWVGPLLAAAEEAERLRTAIAEHHAQRADDRCIADDDRLYAAAGLPPCDRRVGDKEAMLENCKRFIERRCEGGGPWKSYAELEAENEQLRCQLPEGMEHCSIKFKSCPLGHGRLTATNWVDHGCPTCEMERLRAALKPFAEWWQQAKSGDYPYKDGCILDPIAQFPPPPAKITVGDCRRAAEARAPLEEEPTP